MIPQNVHITEERRQNPKLAAALHVFDAIGHGHSYIHPFGIAKCPLLRDSQELSRREQIMVAMALEIFEKGSAQSETELFRWPDLDEALTVLEHRDLTTLIRAFYIRHGKVKPTVHE